MPQAVPSGKLTKNYGKSPFLMGKLGKLTINGPFSIAMLNYQRVYPAAVSTCQDTSLRSYFSPGHAELSALEARRDKARFYDKKPVPWQRKNIACFISPVFSQMCLHFARHVTFKFCEFNLDSWSILFRSMVLSPQKAFLFIIPIVFSVLIVINNLYIIVYHSYHIPIIFMCDPRCINTISVF